MAVEENDALRIVSAALLSHSNFGSNQPALKMRCTLELGEQTPWLEVDEMHGDVALDPKVRRLIMPNSSL
jgi:malate dehydrogenase (oxaloacetate-decarboxylating)(NADP+)